MQFIVIAYDGEDENALQRRLAVREKHLQGAAELHKKGHLLCASAILDDAGAMLGSMILVDFPSREHLEKDWLAHEPYMLGQV
jgi:uncharacterized protein